MLKEKTEQKKKAEEIKKEDERFNVLKEETGAFLRGAAEYFFQNGRLIKGVVSRLVYKASSVLGEELGEDRADYRKRARIFVFCALVFLSIFIISSTSFSRGVYPLSVALVASAGSRVRKRERSPGLLTALVFFTVILSTLRMGESGLVYFTAVFTVFMMRSIVTKGAFDESLSFRTMTAFFAALIVGASNAAIHSFGIDTIFSALALAVITPVFTYVFSGLFINLGDKIVDTASGTRAEVALAAAFFALVLGVSRIGLFGFSLSAVLSFFVTLAVAKCFGSMRGGVFGMIGGIASGGGLFSAVFGVVGVLSAVFFSTSDLLAVCVSVFISSAVSVYVGGFDGLIRALPEVLFASLMAYPVLKRLPVRKEKISLVTERGEAGGSCDCETVENRLEKMSGTFATLSEVFYAVTDTLKTPSAEDLSRCVDNAFNKVCATCSMSGMCWSKHYADSRETKNAIFKKILTSPKVTELDFPEFFTRRCTKVPLICDGINRRFSTLVYNASDTEKANLIAGEYRTVAKLLHTAASFSRDTREDNRRLAGRAALAMRSLAIPYGRIEAKGERGSVVDVIAVSPENITKSAGEILSAFRSECEMLFEEPEFIKLETTSVMRLRRRAAITLECAKKSVSKKDEKVNGDSTSFFEKEDGYFFSLLCDGMGSGRDAALTSKLAAVFLEKILTCTEDKKVTLEMLNTLLMSRKNECFTTLDLAEIDLFDSRVTFIKAGAAPSFLLRGDKIYKVNSETPPAGIIPSLSAEETRVSVKDGDTVLMVSDGISGEDGGAWLVELLDGRESMSAEETCALILNTALVKFTARDDMSVAVIKVHSTDK